MNQTFRSLQQNNKNKSNKLNIHCPVELGLQFFAGQRDWNQFGKVHEIHTIAKD
jgi:hypothetical protein